MGFDTSLYQPEHSRFLKVGFNHSLFLLYYIVSSFKNACSAAKFLDSKGENDLSWWMRKCVITTVVACFKTLPNYLLRETKKKKGSQDCTPQDKELYPESSKCKAVVLINDTVEIQNLAVYCIDW